MFAEYLTDLDANLERRRARFQTGGDGKLEFSWGEGFLDSEGHRASMQATQIWHRASMQATQIWHRASMQATQIWHRASMQATHTVLGDAKPYSIGGSLPLVRATCNAVASMSK
eukprot:jgi/Chrpa1/13170/Chrysochromulina_OHIO_Genome00021358-RA